MAKLQSTPTILDKSISYATKTVDTSVALLSSPEDQVVVEALMYVSKFITHDRNLRYLQQHGILERLLNLLDRNILILKLALRLLGLLLTIDEVMAEIDQPLYDDKILKISSMTIWHEYHIVQQLCVLVLSRLSKSNRILCLIFEGDLFHPIMKTIKTTDLRLLERALELFLSLLGVVPSALDVLPEVHAIDISILISNLASDEKNVVRLCFEIIHKLTHYCLDRFQSMFRDVELVEYMLRVVMDSRKEENHEIALDIIINSMKSKETSDYFVESSAFLKFCQWVKTCDKKYLFPCIVILERLTRIPSRKQLLFDLSVEQSILSFLRSTEKKTLNKTCEAIGNMADHKYCCEELLRPAVLKELFQILLRKDQEDPGNEVALKTIVTFSRKNLDTLNIIYKLGAHKVLLSYFKRDDHFISEESFLGILEILYRMSLHPIHRLELISTSFFEKLLKLFQRAPIDVATLACEIMTNLVVSADFRRMFLALGGPKIFSNALQSSKDPILSKNILFFIHSGLIYEEVIVSFVSNGLVRILNDFSEVLKLEMPIADKILNLVYDENPSMKFFYTKKLNVTDKLKTKFYLIDGRWTNGFPLIEELERLPVATEYTVYVVDYSLEVKYEDENSESSTISGRKISSERAMSTLTKISSSMSSYLRRNSYNINYGTLSTDPFLPRYIYHVSKYIDQASTMEEKIKIVAKYVDAAFCKPVEGYAKIDKIHNFKLHIQILKHKLGSTLIPIGFLRLGEHCERALFFKAVADRCNIPATLVKGKGRLYWNEVFLIDGHSPTNTVKVHVVDLMYSVGKLLATGSSAANEYCDLNRRWRT